MKIYIKENGKEKEINTQIIDLKPSDVVIVKLPFLNSAKPEEINKCVSGFREIFSNNKIVFVNDDSDISIIRNSDNNA